MLELILPDKKNVLHFSLLFFQYNFFGVCYLVTTGIDRVWWTVRPYEGTWW